MSAPLFHMFERAPKPVAPFSHAVEVDGWVFVTGQLPLDPADDKAPIPEGVEDQTVRVFENLSIVLKGMELGLGDVVSARVFLTHFERDYERMNAVYATYFPPDRRPARTCVGVTALARGCLVEIDLIAKRPNR
jgi:reactive intermediate/imine deaminase